VSLLAFFISVFSIVMNRKKPCGVHDELPQGSALPEIKLNIHL
jgi:hypothetical protein